MTKSADEKRTISNLTLCWVIIVLEREGCLVAGEDDGRAAFLAGAACVGAPAMKYGRNGTVGLPPVGVTSKLLPSPFIR